MQAPDPPFYALDRLTPHGVSGLKYFQSLHSSALPSLTPHGVSGLKLELGCAAFVAFWSHPAWGEWIEMRNLKPIFADAASHPAWGEWIEIMSRRLSFSYQKNVSPRMG